jgi:hypothetical protein
MADRKNNLAPQPVNKMARPYFGNPNIAAQGAKARALRNGYASPEQVTDVAKTALGFTPIVGDVMAGYDAIQAARQGNYGEAALNAVGLLPFVPPMAGIFVGKGSKTWNKAMNDLAQDLEKRGMSPEKIWEVTGNFKSPDGQWRQEISDDAAKFRTNFDASIASKANQYKGGIEGPLGGMLTHQELYGAYPELLRTNRMTVTKLPDWLPSSAESGMHSRTFSGKGKTDVRAKTEAGALDTTIHELQHAVQNFEQFPAGGTESMFGLGDEAFQKYRLLAGEAEARAAAARRLMTERQRRVTFPLNSYDVPINQLIMKK